MSSTLSHCVVTHRDQDIGPGTWLDKMSSSWYFSFNSTSLFCIIYIIWVQDWSKWWKLNSCELCLTNQDDKIQIYWSEGQKIEFSWYANKNNDTDDKFQQEINIDMLPSLSQETSPENSFIPISTRHNMVCTKSNMQSSHQNWPVLELRDYLIWPQFLLLIWSRWCRIFLC